MSRLYTYLPKDNTALTEGLLSTALSDKGFEKYRGRTGKYKKEDVLKVLDSWEPEWTRSKAVSALTEPIPEDAAEDFLEFARNRRLYSFSVKDLIKAKILAHLRRTRKGGGTDPVDEVREERPNWHRKKKHLLFQCVPHYMVETTEGRIPPEFVREEKRAQAFSQDGKTVTLSRGQTPSHVVAAYNKTHPSSKITVPQFLKANGNLDATKFQAGKAYSMPVSSPAAAASAKPVAKPVAKAAPAPAPAATAPSAGPLGFRQNNPGNLRSDGKTRWQGSTGVPAAGEFLTFSSPYQGVRAMARTLFNYGRRHKIDSLEGVVDRYAPAKENNQEAYLASVRRKTGLKPGDRIDLTDEATLQNLVPAMGSHEIGPRYFSTYDPSMVSNAVARAVR